MSNQNTLKNKYIDIILTLLAVVVMGFYLHGIRVIQLLLVGIATAVVLDFIAIRLRKQHFWKKNDASFIITAIIIVLALPASAPLWMPIVGVAVALFIAKHPFGGVGNNIFNPAATAIAFLGISWSEILYKYPLTLTNFGIDSVNKINIFTKSPASILSVGGTPTTDYFDVFFGKYAGPIGGTCMVVLGCCLFYLLMRKTVSIKMVLPAIMVVAFFAIVAPRVLTGRVSSIIHELSSGIFIFGLIFMASDPTTMPKSGAGQILSSVFIGLFVVMFRRFGATEFAFIYSLLLVNALADPLDKLAAKMKEFINSFDKAVIPTKKKAGVGNE